MEEDADIFEGSVVCYFDGRIKTFDSEHSDDELYETFSLFDSNSCPTGPYTLAFIWLL